MQQETSIAFFSDIVASEQLPASSRNKEYYKLIFENAGYVDSPDKFVFPYSFISQGAKRSESLLGVFSAKLNGLQILVVSPFSKSIIKNFSNRNHFFKSPYKYPDFSLKTLDSPITYEGLPRELYPHNSWLETLEGLKIQIESIQFDIALLSCGSYAMPLGSFICNKMNKSAIYMGGFLQIFFGIMGRRYQARPGLLGQINTEAFISPAEKSQYLTHINVSDNSPTEAFGAYF